ncbi:hypothetical protein [Bacteroides sp.]|uniref:A1S_2505 family phage non-structural protein n=1 Tax=Bacteroides sp. TaxID=29523 RepID=UPI003A95C21B
MKRELTPENIQELKENQIFVFGSNMNGNHAGGAARLAVEKFGAIMGQAEGIQGQSYAIPTLDKDMQKVTEEELVVFLGNFGNYANEHPEKEFLLTAIGTGIAGFDASYMAYMLLRANLPDNVTLPKEFIKIKGYKGFNPDLTCRDFQYEEGKDYEETGDIMACDNGFHFCLHPLDVFGYYPPAIVGMNKFHEVEGTGDMDVDTDDTKIACSKIHIGAELSIKSIVDAAVKFTFEKCKWKKGKSATGDYGAASATGYQGAASATGYQGAASATGDQGAASATGDYGAASATGYQGAASATGDRGAASATGNQGAASATGDRGAASATGDRGAASATGYRGAASATGDRGAASATGDYGAASATGDYGAASATGDRGAASATGDQGAASATGDRGAASATGNQGAASATGDRGAASATGYQGAASATGDRGAASATGYQGAASATGDRGAASATGNQGAASATGKDSIALAAGYGCKAKGAIGCWIVLAERGEWDGDTYPIKEVKAFEVDGEKVKADTWYMLVNGQLKEV